jgi:hypothetical protein
MQACGKLRVAQESFENTGYHLEAFFERKLLDRPRSMTT